MSILGSAAGSLLGAGIGQYTSARNLRKSYKYALRYGNRMAQTQRNQFDILYPGANVHDLLGGSPQTPAPPLGASSMAGPDMGGNMVSLASAQLAADTQVETAQIQANAQQNAAATSADAVVGSASISSSSMIDVARINDTSRRDVSKLVNAATVHAAEIGIQPQSAEIQLKKAADFYGLSGNKLQQEIENIIARTDGQLSQNITEAQRAMESGTLGTNELRNQILTILGTMGALFLGKKTFGAAKLLARNPGFLKEAYRAARRLNIPIIGQKARFKRGQRSTERKVAANNARNAPSKPLGKPTDQSSPSASRTIPKPAAPKSPIAGKLKTLGKTAGKVGRRIPYVSLPLLAYDLIYMGVQAAAAANAPPSKKKSRDWDRDRYGSDWDFNRKVPDA